MDLIHEKKHRLNNKVYTGFLIVSFTACVRDLKNLFVSDLVFKSFENYLIDSLNKFDCEAFVYLFMPNHVHSVIGGKTPQAKIKSCFDLFKQKTGFWLSQNNYQFKWQKDYYDHILRKQEDLERVIKYVLMNPVRKGLVNNWKEYKYKGSTIYNLEEWKL